MAVITIPRPFAEEKLEGIAELEAAITKFKVNLIRWMFIFWVGQIGVITGILFAFFKR